ncbi:hypothetical protein COU80_01085 [Candidatus Peregrinibacteria bacterium CG10_big_fil_rev_8_21_14_0_10_55_24]|nr:MAG: hypothetical protein COU80_01085 [Candidatus Peregrinibacteria bacterium CG10_big_fil_rev_8_21_14_0_10_55_24]
MADSSVPLPVMPTPRELYDALMGEIEPELTTAQLPLLREKYKTESSEDSQIRRERYRKAFTHYDERFREYVNDLTSQVNVYRKSVLTARENRDKENEQAVLSEIESALSTL